MLKISAATARWLAALGLAAWAGTASADPSEEAHRAAELVRQTYYEGLPYEAVRAITDAGAAQLIALLDDPTEAAHAPNIVIALGIAARPGAFEALAAVAERGSSGAVDRATFQLRTAIPIAMGHLARSDDRALTWLLARAEPGSDPGWWCGTLSGQRLADLLRRRVIAGLALSGRPEADTFLRQLVPPGGGPSGSGDPKLAGLVETARDVRARIAGEGADAVLATPEAK